MRCIAYIQDDGRAHSGSVEREAAGRSLRLEVHLHAAATALRRIRGARSKVDRVFAVQGAPHPQCEAARHFLLVRRVDRLIWQRVEGA